MPQKLDEAFEEAVEEEVKRQLETLSIRVCIGGKRVDIDSQEVTIDGGINIDIGNPLFFSETGKTGHLIVETPKSMEI